MNTTYFWIVTRNLPTTSASMSIRSDNIRKAVQADVAKALDSVKEHMAKLQNLDLEKALDLDWCLGSRFDIF